MKLVLQKKHQNPGGMLAGGAVMMTPPLGGDYWTYRVVVAEGQAVVGFPKFGTLGIGFEVEEDWNTNLPYSCTPAGIFNHIKHNKGHELISDETCLRAIEMVRDAAMAGKGVEW